jgi:hypothetical protein
VNAVKPVVAAGQVLLILPAVLFLGVIVVRNLPLQQYESAYTAQRIVLWYATRQWTLWVLLIALPLAVFVAGCFTFLSGWNDVERPRAARQTLTGLQAQLSRLVAAAATLMAGGILAIVVVHMLAN